MPLKQHAAQIRHLLSCGLTVRTKPNGAPLVMRTHFEEVMNKGKKKPTGKREPNRTALIESFKKQKRGNHGNDSTN
ncbi:MAG: hypothetical protein WC073_05185 [Sterolibacterium sp.]